MKKIIFLLTVLTASFAGKAQDIKFTVPSLGPDTSIYLAKYFGEKLYYADTAQK